MVETHKIIYFEYGGQMNCHYNPLQDRITPEQFLNQLKVSRDGDDIRVDWHNRFIMMNYTGGEQIIKVYQEEREWDEQGNSTRKSYELVKSLEVPTYQGKQPSIISQPSTGEIPTPPTSRPTTPKTVINPKEPSKKDTSHLDEHQKELAEHLDPEKSSSEILKRIKDKKKKTEK